jgi:hypothetical protein
MVEGGQSEGNSKDSRRNKLIMHILCCRRPRMHYVGQARGLPHKN